MKHKTMNGFVLETLPLTDHSFVISVYTREEGVVKGVYRAPRGKHYSRAHLGPLNEIGFSLSGKEQQALKRFSEDLVLRETTSICARVQGLSLMQHWAFLVAKSQPEWEPDERIYRLVAHCLTWVLTAPTPDAYYAANAYFELWLLHLCGMFPRITSTNASQLAVKHGWMTLNGDPLAPIDAAWRHTDTEILTLVFKSKIEQFVSVALEWKGLTRVAALLGGLWEQYLSRESKARRMFMECFENKGMV